MAAGRTFSIALRPVWRDMDPLRHVNNAVYSTWLESTRRALWLELTGADFDLFPFMLARTEIDFRSPVTWRDEVKVEAWVSRIGTTSFELTYALRAGGGRAVADARSVQVLFDHAAGRKVEIDPDLRRRLESYACQTR